MGAEARADHTVIWSPQPGPQRALLECPVFEVFYGGARGGGKTDGMLGEWAFHAHAHEDAANGVFFRRELTQLDEAIARSHELYAPVGADWNEQKKTWVFPNGARLKFRYLDRDSHAEAYQGHSYTRIYFEELTNFPDPKPVMKLKATLRSAKGVPCCFRATGNPGGPGHQWVRERYITPAPAGFKVIEDADGLRRVFIPARLQDNPILLDSDPTYVARIKQSGSEQLVKAWLEGDWNVIEGAYFDCWSTAQHVIRPCELPEWWFRFRSMDWGSAKPFSVGWWAVAGEDWLTPDGAWIPKGALIRYREWYGAKEPNVGLKLTAEEVGQGIVSRETGEDINHGVIDPAAFAEDGGPSIAERLYKQGAKFRRADNKRVGVRGAMGGWDMMRARLKGQDFGEPMGQRPMVYVFSTCGDTIRTVPALQHDEKRPEDVDTEQEDHAADEFRYACMSRPWQAQKPTEPEDIRGMEGLTMNRLWEEQGKQRAQRI